MESTLGLPGIAFFKSFWQICTRAVTSGIRVWRQAKKTHTNGKSLSPSITRSFLSFSLSLALEPGPDAEVPGLYHLTKKTCSECDRVLLKASCCGCVATGGDRIESTSESESGALVRNFQKWKRNTQNYADGLRAEACLETERCSARNLGVAGS